LLTSIIFWEKAFCLYSQQMATIRCRYVNRSVTLKARRFILLD
jgi:hypothetical protein